MGACGYSFKPKWYKKSAGEYTMIRAVYEMTPAQSSWEYNLSERWIDCHLFEHISWFIPLIPLMTWRNVNSVHSFGIPDHVFVRHLLIINQKNLASPVGKIKFIFHSFTCLPFIRSLCCKNRYLA